MNEQSHMRYEKMNDVSQLKFELSKKVFLVWYWPWWLAMRAVIIRCSDCVRKNCKNIILLQLAAFSITIILPIKQRLFELFFLFDLWWTTWEKYCINKFADAILLWVIPRPDIIRAMKMIWSLLRWQMLRESSERPVWPNLDLLKFQEYYSQCPALWMIKSYIHSIK